MTSNAEIVTVPIRDIDPNPFRLLGDFPYSERKLKALKASIADVGMWPGIIGRKVGNKVQIAFGHHRSEAARQSEMADVPVILLDLTDLQMLQYMGRENLEDFNADMPTMLETWRAAKKFSEKSGKDSKAIEIARILGWVDIKNDEYQSVVLNATARTCQAVDAVINGGYMAISDFRGLALNVAKDIAERTLTRIEQQEKLGSMAKQPRHDIERGKQTIGKAGKATAEDFRQGIVAKRDLRSRVDQRALNVMATETAKPSPMFAVFAKALSNSINLMLREDAAAARLSEIVKARHLVQHIEDKQAIERIKHDLDALAARADDWNEKLSGKSNVTMIGRS